MNRRPWTAIRRSLARHGATPVLLIACALAACGSASGLTTRSVGTTGGPSTSAASPAGRVPVPPTYPGGGEPPPAVRDSGIFAESQAPFGQSVLRVVNQYQGIHGRKWISVYAGEKTGTDGSPVGGAIRVYSGPIDPKSPEAVAFVGEFTVPTAPTWVRIVRISGSALIVEGPDGVGVNFDLDSLSFR